ncbi:MAG TPA: histidine phosphatase family protein [Pseudorhizobium sp.]|nr:histidine phosphatase family protein [Pseudorhizobium sp.]
MPGLFKKNHPQQRRLLLLRHAKSAWPEDMPDHQRPLAERGLVAAPAMGNYMAREHLLPDLVLVSDARRTQETWDLVKRRLPDEPEARLVPELYEAPSHGMLDVLRRTEVEAATVLMMGHNPGMQELALMLVGEGNLQARAALAEKFPTAALAVIDFPCFGWMDLEPGSGTLSSFVTPRSLR